MRVSRFTRGTLTVGAIADLLVSADKAEVGLQSSDSR